MRAIALLALVAAAPAAAQPAPNKPDKRNATRPAEPPVVRLPDVVKEATIDRPTVARGGAIGIDGTRSSGIVVTPPAHADARPWPEGAIITPPDPNDPMALELGTNQLRSRDQIEPWLPRDLSKALKRGADKLWDLVLPEL